MRRSRRLSVDDVPLIVVNTHGERFRQTPVPRIARWLAHDSVKRGKHFGRRPCSHARELSLKSTRGRMTRILELSEVVLREQDEVSDA